MLSRKQMRRLIEATYGKSNQSTKQIARLYRNAKTQINGEISRFVNSEDNWQGKPEQDDLDDIRQELQQLGNNDDIAPLVAVFYSAVTLGHPKVKDVETARLAVPLLRVAEKQHEQLHKVANNIPQKVAKISGEQAQLTPQLHQLPFNYSLQMQQEVSRSISKRSSTGQYINRDIQQTISKIKDVCKQASQSTDAHHDFTKDIDRILTGTNSRGGASKRAQTIMRTETCSQLNSSTIADFQARGVQQYRFMSLEADNSCAECTDIDGNVYDVDDAQEGVNLPPMHPNCQCWIVEVEDEDYDNGADLPITEDS